MNYLGSDLTEWFHNGEKPVRKGIYMTAIGKFNGPEMRFFDGLKWSVAYKRGGPYPAFGNAPDYEQSLISWCGINEIAFLRTEIENLNQYIKTLKDNNSKLGVKWFAALDEVSELQLELGETRFKLSTLEKKMGANK